VPTVPAIVAIVAVLVAGRDPGEHWDSDPETYAVAYLIAWAIIAGLLVVGIAAHKLAAGHQRSASS
jgi:hypothetical protein